MSPIPLQLVWGDGFVSVQPTFPESLLKELSYWRRLTEIVGYKKNYINRKEELFVIEPYQDPANSEVLCRRLTVLDGFMSLIKKELTKAGYPFTVRDARTPRLAPDIDRALEGLWEKQKPAVYTMLMSGGGVLSMPTGYGKTRMSAGIINGYSHEQMKLRGTPLTIFAAPEQEINSKNYEELKAALPGRNVGIMQSNRKHIITDDVMCVTLDSLENINPDDVGLFICDEVHTGVSDTRSANIQDMKRAVKYGVSATPGGRYDGKDLVITGLFGPVVYEKTYQEAVEDGILVPIKVVWIEAPEPDHGMNYYGMLKSREGRLRHAVTANTGCNTITGEILKGLPHPMQAIAIMPTIDQMSMILPKAGPGVRVAHAKTTAKALMGIGTGNVPPLPNKERKQLYKDIEAGKVDRVISTYVYKQGVNFPGLEVMINAGGGGGEIAAKQIPGRVSRTTKSKDKAWLVDFWHPWDIKLDRYGKKVPNNALSDDKKRKKFYTQLGFEQVTVKTAAEFLALVEAEQSE